MKTWAGTKPRGVQERVAAAALACLALACNGADGSGTSSSSLFEAPSGEPAGELFGGDRAEPAGETPAASPCEEPHSSPENPRIDDFEDGDAQIHRVFERDGWWWVGADETPGTMTPAQGAVRPSELPEGGLAMHFAAAGFSSWGAVLGTSLEWSSEGVACAFNAGGYDGFSFRAKGSGSLPVQVLLPDTSGLEGGDARSRCSDSCWDHYQVVIQLAADWARHEVRWSDLQQGGWGKAVPFDAKHVLGISFSPKPEDLPVDVWIDDLEFIPR